MRTLRKQWQFSFALVLLTFIDLHSTQLHPRASSYSIRIPITIPSFQEHKGTLTLSLSPAPVSLTGLPPPYLSPSLPPSLSFSSSFSSLSSSLSLLSLFLSLFFSLFLSLPLYPPLSLSLSI